MAAEVRQIVKNCKKNCWMIGSAAPAIWQHPVKPIKWVLKNKIRLLAGKDLDISAKPNKIVVLGTRGFPNVQGGIEKHCENIYPQLVKKGCQVTVLARKPYVGNNIADYSGVRLIPLSCPKNKFLEAFTHTLFGVFVAKNMGCDVLHFHAVGPSLLVPLARLLGLKVVMTNHGPDYKRKKWGRFAKIILKFGEYLGSKLANRIICISETIADSIRKNYKREVTVIPNGVAFLGIVQSNGEIEKYDLIKGKYILAVGRFVPEKGFGDLMDAFEIASSNAFACEDMEEVIAHKDMEEVIAHKDMEGVFAHKDKEGVLARKNREEVLAHDDEGQGTMNGWKLVIVGDADHPDKYSLGLKDKANKNNNVVLTGFLTGEPLRQFYGNAGLFVLPSYYEGLPIVLLEAMSYGLSCIASDIPANRNVELSRDRFFKAGDVQELAAKMEEFSDRPFTEKERRRQMSTVAKTYDWSNIARKTMEVYEQVILGS